MTLVQHLEKILGPSFQLFLFGSSLIGTEINDSDVDIMVGCLNGNTIDDCRNLLEQHPEIKVLNQIQTFVPLLKLVVNNTPVDIIFTEFDKPVSSDTTLMQAIKPTDANARAVNGVLVSQWLMQNIPNFDVFRLVVKEIKLWAMNKNIYGTMLGYPGGMAWTLMIAKIFQEYDTTKSSVEQIITIFFNYYKNWNWPSPVLLAPRDDVNKQYKNWNPYRYQRDYCFMAVITPVYPTMNSTYCVTRAALQHIKLCFCDALPESNWFNAKITPSEDDDGTFKLKLKSLCSKIYEREGVSCVYPFQESYIKIFYKGDLNLDGVFDGFEYDIGWSTTK